MKLVVQRSINSSVTVNNKKVGSIEKGLVVLVAFTLNDNEDTIKKMVKKLINLRIFNDEFNIMNKSVLDINGQVLSISQFTLYASCNKGNRPSYIKALKSDEANILYNIFNKELSNYVKVETGIFGSDMSVSITNDGPVTIILESE